jgi:hypothetical protein
MRSNGFLKSHNIVQGLSSSRDRKRWTIHVYRKTYDKVGKIAAIIKDTKEGSILSRASYCIRIWTGQDLAKLTISINHIFLLNTAKQIKLDGKRMLKKL